MSPLLSLVLVASVVSVPQGKREPVAPLPAPHVEVAAPAAEPVERWVSGRLLDEGGAALAGWTVRATASCVNLFRLVHDGRLGATPWDREARTDEQGRFRFPWMPAFAVVLASPDESRFALREDFRLDGDEILLRLRPEDQPTAFVEGSLLVPRGVPLEAAQLLAVSADVFETRSAPLHPGRFRLGPLRPGEHILTVEVEGLAPLRRTVRVGECETLELGELALEPPGTISVQLDASDVLLGAHHVVYTSVLCPEPTGLRPCGAVRSGPGAERTTGLCSFARVPPAGHSFPLAAGRYVLRTRDERWFAPDVAVEVVAGRTTEVVVRLEAAQGRTTARDLLLRLPPGDPSTHLDLAVRDARGEWQWSDELLYRWDDHPIGVRLVGLVRGTYALEARSPTGLVSRATFEIRDLEPMEKPLEFELH